MRVGFIGCVDFSAAVLSTLLGTDGVSMVAVATKERSPFNADFLDLAPLAARDGIPVFHQAGADQTALGAWLAERAPDVIFCVGWPNLLDASILSLPRHGVVGYHPTDLPNNRGRHPIIWTLALGLTETASTFFRMDRGADSGPIMHKVMVPVSPDDDAASLYARLQAIACDQVREVATALATGAQEFVAQDLASGNIWRKRDKSDGRIDWRMPAIAIVNLVRALGRPYPGAFLEAKCAGSPIEASVWRARVASCPAVNIEPGKVLAVKDRLITIKAGIDAVELLDHELAVMPAEGDYL